MEVATEHIYAGNVNTGLKYTRLTSREGDKKERIGFMKNKIILVGGYCATGKSTFARRLSRELNIPCFEKDIIKETLGDAFGSESGEVSKKGSFATFRLMLHMAERFMQAGQACILESNFTLQEVEEIKDLLEEYKGECRLFVFKGDLDVLFDRYIDRDEDETEERHWVHRKVLESDRDGFKDVMEGWHGIEEAGIKRTVVVDATVLEDIDYENLFDIAKGFLVR